MPIQTLRDPEANGGTLSPVAAYPIPKSTACSRVGMAGKTPFPFPALSLPLFSPLPRRAPRHRSVDDSGTGALASAKGQALEPQAHAHALRETRTKTQRTLGRVPSAPRTQFSRGLALASRRVLSSNEQSWPVGRCRTSTVDRRSRFRGETSTSTLTSLPPDSSSAPKLPHSTARFRCTAIIKENP